MTETRLNLGKVSLTPQGEYNEQTHYKRLDVVSHQGNSYLVLQPFRGIEPAPENPYVMLLAAKGEKGDSFTYEDFTVEQLAGLKGETGRGFNMLGYQETLLDLEALVTHPVAGDAWAVGTEAPYDIYLYDGPQEAWLNLGPLEGPQGETGPTGKSAYEIAVEHGFEGTELEWLYQFVTPDELQEKINQLGAITYIALVTDDPEEMNRMENLRPGAIALVKEEDPTESNQYREYIWLNPEEDWEFLGMVNTFDLEKYYTKEEVDGKTVQLSGEQEVSGKKYFKDILCVGKNKTLSEDGNPGLVFSTDGNIEICSQNPYIDFHYKNSTKDYTSRIIDQEEGLNLLSGSVKVNGYRVWHTGYIKKEADLYFRLENCYHLIDLTDEMYDQNTWYPVVSSSIVHANDEMIPRFCISTNLNRTNGIPSWADHKDGFTANIDFNMRGNKWGTSSKELTINHFDCLHIKSLSNPPIGIAQMTSSNSCVLYLRGGAKYPVLSTVPVTWTIYTETYSKNDQSVSPEKEYPGISNLYSRLSPKITHINKYGKFYLGSKGTYTMGNVYAGKGFVTNIRTQSNLTFDCNIASWFLCTLSNSSSLSITNMNPGSQIFATIHSQNTNGITLSLPTTGEFRSMSGSSVFLPYNTYSELVITNYGDFYLVKVTVGK